MILWRDSGSAHYIQENTKVKYFLMAKTNTKILDILISTINVNTSEHLKQLGSYSIYQLHMIKQCS